MQSKFLIIEDSFFYKKGTLLSEGVLKEDGLYLENDKKFISKKQLINLNEALTPQDQEKVRELVRELLKKMMWRMYTRNQFLLQ